MAEVLAIKAREVLDSRGNPTVECDVTTQNGTFRAAVPSGASTGIHEALELRDLDGGRYGGKGVLKAVDNVNKKIAPLVLGADPTKQRDIDRLMIGADGTEGKSSLGANAILSVSMAVCTAGAAAKEVPLYQHIADLGGNDRFVLPVPMVLVLEGGSHADQSSDFQEFMVMPYAAGSFREAMRMGSEIYHAIGKILKKGGFNTNVGFEGAYGPSLGSNEKVLQLMVEGIEGAGYKPGEEILIAIDPAASEFFEGGKYSLEIEERVLDSSKLADLYAELCGKYPIISIEDGLAEDDWDGYVALNRKLGQQIQVMGDDLTATNVKRLQKAIDLGAINSILIKPNQIGTVTETLDTINLAKRNGLTSVVSHRSGETEDPFIADLVVGMATGQCKFGATARGERTAKYNQLMRIEEELGGRASYAGRDFRKP